MKTFKNDIAHETPTTCKRESESLFTLFLKKHRNFGEKKNTQTDRSISSVPHLDALIACFTDSSWNYTSFCFNFYTFISILDICGRTEIRALYSKVRSYSPPSSLFSGKKFLAIVNPYGGRRYATKWRIDDTK